MSANGAPKALVLSASVGSSHNSMAEALRAGVLANEPAADVTVLKNFRPLGRRLGPYLDTAKRARKPHSNNRKPLAAAK